MKLPPAMLKRWPRRLSPRSLRSQLLIRSLFILGILLLLIGSFQYVIMQQSLYRSKAETMDAQLRSLPKDLTAKPGSAGRYDGDNGKGAKDRISGKPPDGEALPPERGGGRLLVIPDMSLASVDASGSYTELLETAALPSPELDVKQLADIRAEVDGPGGRVRYLVAEDTEGTEQLLVFRNGGGPGGGSELLQMGTPTSSLRSVLMQQLLIFGGLSALALVGGLMLYVSVLRRTLVPLSNMVQTVERTDAGNLTERFPATQGQEEIDLLANSFNGMLERLQASFAAEVEAKEQMRRFIADASHELRTPLTSIHGFLEVLLRGAAERKEQLYPALSSMQGESRRMKKLVEDLLLLAKLDRAPELQLKPTSLAGMLLDMEPQLKVLAAARSLELNLPEEDPVSALLDADKIKQVLLNLYHNAVQHTDAETGRISVKLSREQGMAVLEVADNGSGIDPVHLPHLFERFYRSDSSRTRKYGGAGLGLAISKSITEAHGGGIEAASSPGAGSTFTVRLPIHDRSE
ncbi:two-component sensor histidine kinase [Paenibacillus sambharensis]|uniref:histidine kinase n=1 Tax=Paenibacillus sambharensis TaxID=1803190 RepID=A0A2W1L780_9BACL|nr:HAMP domain-containing sensor histidine kinase [Paenibacillus sambharensis]PZD93990.1 two-component sensor histidine kinase [Paenibacillus sambharensis]